MPAVQRDQRSAGAADRDGQHPEGDRLLADRRRAGAEGHRQRLVALCDAYDAAVLLRDGDDLRFNAHHGPIPIGLEKWPINRRWTAGRAFVDQKPVHIENLQDETNAEFSDGRELSLRMGHRSILSVPLLREKESIGAIVLRRNEVHPFTDKQISMLQTFADQAVIAIGNVRLFEEVQAKTNDLSEALRQQTATSEVLSVISSSAGDLAPVLRPCLARPCSFVARTSAPSTRSTESSFIPPPPVGSLPSMTSTAAAMR
jgi:GAF domain-containing protein